MLILALDVSSKSTGWSVILDGKLTDGYGLISPNKKFSQGAKLSFFREQIKTLYYKYNPDLVIVENIFCGINKISFRCLAEFRGVAFQTLFEITGRDPYSIMAVEARKIMGVGTKKEDAFSGIVNKYNLIGFDFEKDNDIVDSFCLGLAYQKILDGAQIMPVIRSKKRRTKQSTRRDKSVLGGRKTKKKRKTKK